MSRVLIAAVKRSGVYKGPVFLPGCPKLDDRCVAGVYPHCWACDAEEHALVEKADEVIAQANAARAEGRVLGRLDPIVIEAGALLYVARKRQYGRLSDLQQKALSRIYGGPLPE